MIEALLRLSQYAGRTVLRYGSQTRELKKSMRIGCRSRQDFFRCFIRKPGVYLRPVFLYLYNIMRDVSDAMLVAIFSLLSLKLLEGWIAIITGLVAIPYIIVRLILALKRNNREKEQEKRNREQEKRNEEQEKRNKEQEKRNKEKHEMEVRLLQKQLDGEF